MCLHLQERSQARVWNTGDGRLKFIVLQHRVHLPGYNSSGSVDDQELLNTQQARWVALAASVRLESPSAVAAAHLAGPLPVSSSCAANRTDLDAAATAGGAVHS